MLDFVDGLNIKLWHHHHHCCWELRGLVILLLTRFYCRSILVRSVGETCLCAWCHRVVCSTTRPKTVFWMTLWFCLFTTIHKLHEGIFWQFSSCLGTEIFYYLFCCWQRRKCNLIYEFLTRVQLNHNDGARTEQRLSSVRVTLMRGPIQTKPYSNIITNTARTDIDMFFRIYVYFIIILQLQCYVIYLHSFHMPTHLVISQDVGSTTRTKYGKKGLKKTP